MVLAIAACDPILLAERRVRQYCSESNKTSRVTGSTHCSTTRRDRICRASLLASNRTIRFSSCRVMPPRHACALLPLPTPGVNAHGLRLRQAAPTRAGQSFCNGGATSCPPRESVYPKDLYS